MAQRPLTPFLFGAPPAARSGSDTLTMLQREMDRLLNQAFRGAGEHGDTTAALPIVAPRIDISETDREIRVRAELPGVDPDNVEVVVTDDLLTIRGEKRIERDEGQENFHVVERAVGTFARAIRLPFPVDPDQVRADFQNGVLMITLPKPTEAQHRSRRINVQSTGQGQRLSDAAEATRSANSPETSAGAQTEKTESTGQTGAASAQANAADAGGTKQQQ